MSRDLDDLLAASAPPICERTVELQQILSALATESESVAVPTKRRLGRRLGLAGLAATSVFGLGVAANAAGLIQAPWSTTASTPSSYPGPFIHADELSYGRDCKVVYGADESEDPKHPVSKEQRAQALEYAKNFVLTFDIATISIPEALRKYKAEFAEAVKSTGVPDIPPSQLVPDGSPDQIRTVAVLAEIDRRLQISLGAKGSRPTR